MKRDLLDKEKDNISVLYNFAKAVRLKISNIYVYKNKFF